MEQSGALISCDVGIGMFRTWIWDVRAIHSGWIGKGWEERERERSKAAYRP